MPAAILARVSTDGQHVDTQLAALREQARRDGEVVFAEYVDDGVSGGAGNFGRRLGLQRMFADLARRPPPWSVLYVWDVDRLTRSDEPEEQARIIGSLKRAGVALRTRNGEQPSPSTMIGRILLVLQMEGAADWLDKHKARIIAGKRRAISLGRKPAGPTPFGLTYDRATGAWGIDEPNAELCREMVRRCLAGEPCSDIALSLHRRGLRSIRGGLWTLERVWRLLRSPHLRGSWSTSVEGVRTTLGVPAIVDDATWYAVQDALQSRGRRGPRTKHTYLLDGLLTCALCGARIGIGHARQREGDVSYYRCSSRERRRVEFGGPNCKAPGRRCTDVDARAWAALVNVIATPGVLEDHLRRRRADSGAELHDWAADVAGYERQLGAMDRGRAALARQVAAGGMGEEDLARALAEVAPKRALLERQLATARARVADQARAHEDAGAVLANLATLRARAEEATPEDRSAVAHLLVEAAVLGADGGVTLDVCLDAVLPAAGEPVAQAGGVGCSSIRLGNGEDAVRLRVVV